MDTNHVQPTAPKSNKTLIIVGAVALFCLCVCAVAVFAFRSIGKSVVTDPAQVEALAGKIAKYQVPPGYSEVGGMDLGIYQFIMLGSSADPNDTIMLANINVATDPQQMQEQMQRTFEQQTGTPGMTWKTVENRKMTIRGQEVNVEIREGQVEGGPALRQLITAFEGENGTVIVMAQGDAATWDQELLDDFLASIE
ncbi:MAG: hypothetical protein AB1750_13525 [Chloroflexota bacterium]